ncbi:putative cullin-like protein [Megavirus courdo11]|uniref:Putative cullin-like protein n=1 Tax=Megavirus courdo11 TaxID=1128140 RepID=K7YWD3_9VIRU|nr:putative cullin-like protein [Megavirus courdo11]
MDLSKYFENKPKSCNFDLVTNNSKFGVIFLSNKNPELEIENLLNDILVGETPEFNYYRVKQLVSQITLHDINGFTKLIINSIDKKVEIIRNALIDNNEVNLSVYTQIWDSYRNYFKQIYFLVKTYQKNLLDKKINVSKFNMNLLSIIEISMFYNGVINKSDYPNMFSNISDGIENVDNNNIDQLLSYIDSIRLFSFVKEYINSNNSDIINSINDIINKPNVVNILCYYMDKLFKSMTDNNLLLKNVEYNTTNLENLKLKIIININKIATILSYHCKRDLLFLYYKKYFQVRIINHEYSNTKFELEIIKKLSIALGKDNSQQLINMLENIIDNSTCNINIHNSIVKLTSDKYKPHEPKLNILNPLILDKKLWDIYNLSNMDINYPAEIKFCLEIISVYYEAVYENKYTINWQPTMGIVEFQAYLNGKKVIIICNLLQAILLSYFNENKSVTINDFSRNTGINLKLCRKIFKSLFEESVIVKNIIVSQETYIVNQNNYTGGEKINAWKTFIEVFEKEIEKSVDNDPIDESNTISSCNCEIEYSDVDVDVDILEKSSLNDKTQNLDSYTDSDTSFNSDSDSDSEIDIVEKSTNNKNQNLDSYTDSDTSFNSDSDSEIDMVEKSTNNKNQKYNYNSDYSDYFDSYSNMVKSNKENDLLDLDSDSDINIKSDGKS